MTSSKTSSGVLTTVALLSPHHRRAARGPHSKASQKGEEIMTDPPGMVVGVSRHFGDVMFSLWNYTDAEIEVNVGAEAVPPTAPLDNFFQGTNIVVPSNASRSNGGHV